MSQVIVVNSNLKIANNLCNILENRDITVIKAGSDNSKPNFLGIDLVGYQADTIVCSDYFEKEVGEIIDDSDDEDSFSSFSSFSSLISMVLFILLSLSDIIIYCYMIFKCLC